MHSRLLGKSGLECGELSLGTWGLAEQSYGTVALRDFVRTVSAAFDAGVRNFDMAPLWGDGEAESTVSLALGAKRDEVLYTTRCGVRREGGKVVQDFSRMSLVRDCENSLKRLNTDRIDLLLLHNPSVQVLQNQSWRAAMDSLLSQGKIRHWGISTGSPANARTALGFGVEIFAFPYNVFHTTLLSELEEEFETHDCGLLTYAPFAYGLLAKAWPMTQRFVDHRASRWQGGDLQLRLKQANALRASLGTSEKLAAAALRFALTNPLVATTVLGACDENQIRQAVTYLENLSELSMQTQQLFEDLEPGLALAREE